MKLPKTYTRFHFLHFSLVWATALALSKSVAKTENIKSPIVHQHSLNFFMFVFVCIFTNLMFKTEEKMPQEHILHLLFGIFWFQEHCLPNVNRFHCCSVWKSKKYFCTRPIYFVEMPTCFSSYNMHFCLSWKIFIEVFCCCLKSS